MEQLGRAEALDDLDAEAGLPARVERGGQRLARRGREAHARERGEGFGGGRRREQLRDERRHEREHRGPVARDELEHALGRGTVGEQHGRRAHGEREEQAHARGVAEVELGDGERDVVAAEAEHALGVGLDAEGEAPVAVHGGARAAGRAGGRDPHGRIVGGRVDVREARRGRGDRRLVREVARRLGRAAHDERGGERRGRGDGGGGARREVGVREEDLGARVREVGCVVGDWQLGVRHRDGGADLERREERGDEGQAVGQRDEHAIAAPDAERRQHVRDAVRLGEQLGVRHGPAAHAERDARAAPLVDARVEHVRREVEARRDLGAHARYLMRSRSTGT